MRVQFSSFRLQPHKSSALAANERTLVAIGSNSQVPLPGGPFTDFGQFGSGKMDLRFFLQSEKWVDGDTETFGAFLQLAESLNDLSDPY